MESTLPSIQNNKENNEKETKTEKEEELTVIHDVLLLDRPTVKSKIPQTFLVCLSFLLMGVVRTAQGPSLMDLKNQVKATLQDFKLVFSAGTFAFPFGNLVGAFLLKYTNSIRFLSICMLLFAITNTAMVFAPSLNVLVVLYSFNELFMGMIDTACNIAIPQIWGSSKNAPFFNALHFSLGIGNLIGPMITEVFLVEDDAAEVISNVTASALLSPSSNYSNIYNYTTSLTSESENVLSPVEFDLWHYLYEKMSLTDLQGFHCFLGVLILGAGFFDFLVSLLPLKPEPEAKKDPISLKTIKTTIKNNSIYIVIIGAMLAFSLFGNGIYFLVGNFIAIHGLNSPLKMTKSQGARTTAVFFAASVFSKFLSIYLVDLIKDTFFIVLTNLFFVSIGSWFLLALGDTSILFYRLGIGILGFGIGPHFSTGIVWLNKMRQSSGLTTSLLLIATSIGAQVFKIPASKYIMTFPSLIYYITLGSWAVITVSIIVVKVLGSILKKKEEAMDKRIVYRRDSETTSISSAGPIDQA